MRTIRAAGRGPPATSSAPRGLEGPVGEPLAGLDAVALDLGTVEVTIISFPIPRLSGEPPVTLAERAVVRYVLLGFSNAQIARQRHRSERTVANQVSAALRKLHVGSRGELMAALSIPAAPGVAQAPPR